VLLAAMLFMPHGLVRVWTRVARRLPVVQGARA
jgi:hypothetical protein